MAESSNTEGEERGLLSRSTWVSECASVPEEGVLLYRHRGEERGMNLDAADHHNSH
jgi:hypothetical protein